jgi:hypothetical protein
MDGSSSQRERPFLFRYCDGYFSSLGDFEAFFFWACNSPTEMRRRQVTTVVTLKKKKIMETKGLTSLGTRKMVAVRRFSSNGDNSTREQNASQPSASQPTRGSKTRFCSSHSQCTAQTRFCGTLAHGRVIAFGELMGRQHSSTDDRHLSVPAKP